MKISIIQKGKWEGFEKYICDKCGVTATNDTWMVSHEKYCDGKKPKKTKPKHMPMIKGWGYRGRS